MRIILTCVALLTLLTASARAQSAAQSKAAISDEAVINLIGGRMAKMFAAYGTPEDVAPKRGTSPEEDDVFLDYGPFGFRVHKKIIKTCFFFSDWDKPIHGIKIGDSRDDVAKVLGRPGTTVRDKNGMVTAYGYKLKDLDAELFVNFQEDGKVWRVEISLD